MRKIFIFFMFFVMVSLVQAIGERFILWESFEDITPPSWPLGWVTQDFNGDGTTWGTQKYGGLGERPQCVRYAASAIIPADDWFFTGGLTLNPGIPYILSFRYKASVGSIQRMNIWIGGVPLSAGMTTQIYDNTALVDTILTEIMVPFTPSSPGTYFIGFHCYSAPNQARLFVDDIQVSYPETNLVLTVGMVKELLSSGTPTYNLADTIKCVTALENIGPADFIVNERFSVGGVTSLHPELYFFITSPSGDTLPFVWLYEKIGDPGQGKFASLLVSQTTGKVFDLQKGFIFTETGTYTLQVRYQNYHKHPLGTDVWMGRIWSNPVTFILQ